MKYTVKYYRGGMVISAESVEAPNPLRAFNYTVHPKSFSHARVDGSRTVRFGRAGEEIVAPPIAYKIQYRDKYPAILVMFDNLSEIYAFESKTKRNEVFACITSMSAESVTTVQEPTDITACSEETKGSGNTLMLKKILSGYAMNVTWQEKLTQESIDKISGTDKSKDMDTNTCFAGSKGYHSKLPRTLIAKVSIPREELATRYYPGVTQNMYAMNGKTFVFKKTQIGAGNFYKCKGYTWKTSWLDPYRVDVQIKDMPEGTAYETIEYIKPRTNGVVNMKLCSCGCGTYIYKNNYYKPEWLEVYDSEKNNE